jgi:tetratricopeptide (TPR) repeat protein
VLESASVSYGKATLYFPVIDLLKRYCHVDDGDDVRTIRAKVTGQVRAAHNLGQVYEDVGDFNRATELLRQSVEAADRGSSMPGMDFRIRSRAWLARTLSALGAFAEGRRHGEEALRLATLEGRGVAPIIVQVPLGELYLAQGDLEHAMRVFDQGLALCRASGNRDWLRSIVDAPPLPLACTACQGDRQASHVYLLQAAP